MRSALSSLVRSSGSATLSRADSTGIRLKNWKISPTWRARQRASSSSERSFSRWPATMTSPSLGRSIPETRFRSVDFPEPDGPMKPTKWPAGIASETCSRACTSSTPRTERRGALRGCVGGEGAPGPRAAGARARAGDAPARRRPGAGGGEALLGPAKRPDGPREKDQPGGGEEDENRRSGLPERPEPDLTPVDVGQGDRR